MTIKILREHHSFDEAQEACPEGYHIPTKEEIQKILDETTYHFDKDTREGVFVYPDGEEIRFPTGGWRNEDGDVYGLGIFGDYWSSSVASDTEAWVFSVSDFTSYLHKVGQYFGFFAFYIANQ